MRNDFESGYLEHSAKGTSWRKKGAKYLSRVWKNGKWVYEYKITGKGYKRDAETYEKAGDRFGKISLASSKRAYSLRNKDEYKPNRTMDEISFRTEINQKKANVQEAASSDYKQKQETAYKKMREANRGYEKSLAGQIEKGMKAIQNLIASETKETVTDTFTGKTRTPSKSGDTINIKELSEKNKKKKK